LRTALRKVFGVARWEVPGGWRELHNEELHICTACLILLRW